jgi:hypothetical protein
MKHDMAQNEKTYEAIGDWRKGAYGREGTHDGDRREQLPSAASDTKGNSEDLLFFQIFHLRENTCTQSFIAPLPSGFVLWRFI